MKSGLAFHCHHDVLLEFVYDYDERVEYIKNYKPESEQELRLRLFKMIPEELIPDKDSVKYKAYLEASAAYDKACAAALKARAAYLKACAAHLKTRVAYDKAWAACDKASDAYDKARAAYLKAWAAYLKACGKEIEVLHKELCPDCAWDGKSIFKEEK